MVNIDGMVNIDEEQFAGHVPANSSFYCHIYLHTFFTCSFFCV